MADGIAPEEAGRRLQTAYPDMIAGVEGGNIVWRDGGRMKIEDDRGTKSFEDLLSTPDLQDIFAIGYPEGDPSAPAVNADPGRARPEAFFEHMYGNCRSGEVEKNLVDVRWMPTRTNQTIKVTRVNGVAEKLAAISAELERLPRSYDAFLNPVGGTFACRAIAGSEQRSTHGYGIAIDLAVKPSHYWRWSKPDADGRYAWRNSIPFEIVRIFEKHGFIWGGRWYHFDTMHFEYRPELLVK
ncbi:MAG: M15 family metallopeptidase [Deltaproteobacteria bacterium]